MCSLLYINYTSIKRFLKCHGFQERWIGFTLLIQATKKLSKYIKQWLWDTGQDNRQHRRVSFRERKWRQWAKSFTESFSRPQHTERKPKKSLWSFWDEIAEFGNEGVKIDRCEGRKYWRRGSWRESCGGLQRVPFEAAAKFCSVHACKEKRRPPGLQQVNDSWSSPRLRRVHVPTSLHGLTT